MGVPSYALSVHYTSVLKCSIFVLRRLQSSFTRSYVCTYLLSAPTLLSTVYSFASHFSLRPFFHLSTCLSIHFVLYPVSDCPQDYNVYTRIQMNIEILQGNCQDPVCCVGAWILSQNRASGVAVLRPFRSKTSKPFKL